VPAALTVTIPMGVLVGILTGLSRLAADSEITALRASGVGVMMFIKILGIAAIVVTFIAGINNILIAPRSLAALNDLQQHLKSAQASYEVQPHTDRSTASGQFQGERTDPGGATGNGRAAEERGACSR